MEKELNKSIKKSKPLAPGGYYCARKYYPGVGKYFVIEWILTDLVCYKKINYKSCIAFF